MSKKHCECKKYDDCGYGLFGSGKPSLPTLIILILILLQFNGGNGGFFGGKGGKGGFESVDNGILFIIALFYLSCCNPCKSSC
jgi:hypothetical protein